MFPLPQATLWIVFGSWVLLLVLTLVSFFTWKDDDEEGAS